MVDVYRVSMLGGLIEIISLLGNLRTAMVDSILLEVGQSSKPAAHFSNSIELGKFLSATLVYIIYYKDTTYQSFADRPLYFSKVFLPLIVRVM